jgi:hypothetical protein
MMNRRPAILFATAALGPALCLMIPSANARSGAQAQPAGSKAPAAKAEGAPHAGPGSLEAGYQQLYALEFDQSREDFARWNAAHSGDPLGPAAIAASYLFEEFHRQGVLTSEFFLDDERFLEGIKGRPDAERRLKFLAAEDAGRALAEARLRADSNDPRALLAMTMIAGMRANYLAILERKQISSLKYLRESDDYARRLLKAAPEEKDAYLALGAANYVIGSLPAYKKFFLWFGGVRGDRIKGMRQLEIAAREGRLLKPYAMILLALAALREKQEELARRNLEALVELFPSNPIYRGELAKLDARARKPGVPATP